MPRAKKRSDTIKSGETKEENLLNIPIDVENIDCLQNYICEYLSKHDLSIMEILIALQNIAFKAQYLAAQQMSKEQLEYMTSSVSEYIN